MKLDDVLGISNFSFLAQKAMEGFITGIHQSPLHGFSVEFAEHRPYNPGDNIKNLDWKLLAKTEKRYVKQYIEETNLRCHFWIDVSPSMKFPKSTRQKQKFALLAAASMAHLCQLQRDAFSFALFSDTSLEWESEMKSTRMHLQYCIQQLDSYWNDVTQPAQDQLKFEYADLLKTVKRRNMVVILSDFLFDPSQDNESGFWHALSYLQYLKCEVLLLRIQDYREERLFDYGNLPIKFLDLETNQQIQLQPSDYKDAYIDQEQKRLRDFNEQAAQKGLRLFDCEIAHDLKQVLTNFYVNRQRLK